MLILNLLDQLIVWCVLKRGLSNMIALYEVDLLLHEVIDCEATKLHRLKQHVLFILIGSFLVSRLLNLVLENPLEIGHRVLELLHVQLTLVLRVVSKDLRLERHQIGETEEVGNRLLHLHFI